MKSKSSTGYMVMFLETDLKYAKKFDETTLSPVQKAIYQKISESEKEKVRQGYGVSVVDLETGDTICEFNRDTYRPPKRAIEELARALLPEIVEFYKDENNRKEFEEWKKNQEKNKQTEIMLAHATHYFFINIFYNPIDKRVLLCYN